MISEIDWKGQRYLIGWFDEVDFESLENVIHSYGFIFDKNGKFCIVDCNKGYWCLPGGGPEDCDKNFEDTPIREVDEEAEKLYETTRKVSLIDDRINMTFGEKISFSDYIGIPWKIIYGNESYTLKSRDESIEQKFSSLNGLSKILGEIK